jgi:DNA polymerase I-like protein with 3'-5' exonuclease and polymerase domains
MIISADLDSAELRVASWLAQDTPFLEIFARGEKPHLKTAQDLFGKPYGKGTEEYTFAKGFTYRAIYTLPGKLPTMDGQLRLNKVEITEDMLAQCQRKFDRAHPALLNWKRKVIADLEANHKTTNIFGRYRDLSWGMFTWASDVKDHCRQAALNWQVQTVIGRRINDAFIECDQWFDDAKAHGLQGWLCLQVHDELAAYTPDASEIPEIAKALKTAIERPIPQMDNLVIPAELHWGENWGAMVNG